MTFIFFLPLILSLICFFIPKKYVKDFAISFSSIFLLYSIYLLFSNDKEADFHFSYYFPFLSYLGSSFRIAIDGLSLLMYFLTNFVIFYSILLSRNNKYNNTFYFLVFLMQFALTGVFFAFDGILFYIFWELALIPIYLLILLYSPSSKKDFTRFFIYTFVGSLFILAGLIFLLYSTGSNSFDYLILVKKSLKENSWIYILLMTIGFGVKVPIFSLHSWQPNTYKKSNTESTIILSGIMLKMGIYGMLRWVVPFLYTIDKSFIDFILVLVVIGILYGAIIALRRDNLKSILAFSSLSHVGLIVAGLLSSSVYGYLGSNLQMINHGINIVGMFYVVELIKRQTDTYNIHSLGGIAKKAPIFSVLSFIIVLGTIAFPFTNGFAGEVLLLLSLYLYNPLLTIFAGISIILCAAYMLRFYQLTFFGDLKIATQNFKEISKIDILALLFIAILVISIGIYPNFILNFSKVFSNFLNQSLFLR